MKRAVLLVVSLVVALSMSVALCGCASKEYTPEKKEQTVSDSSLKASGTLRVGVDSSNAPYAAESSGTIVGIDVDIAAALADEMGLKLELVDVGSNTSTAFKDENVDIIMGVDEANSAYWMSSSYMTSAIALFGPDETTKVPSTSDSPKIAAQSSSMSAWEVTNHFGESALSNASDLQTAFQNMADGKVSYVAADSTIGEYVAHSSGVSAAPIALLQDPVSHCIAVESSNKTLQDAVKTALSSISNGGVIQVIQQKWLGDQQPLSMLKVIAAPEASTTESTDESSSTSTTSNSSSSSSTSTSSGSSSASSSSSSSNS